MSCKYKFLLLVYEGRLNLELRTIVSEYQLLLFYRSVRVLEKQVDIEEKENEEEEEEEEEEKTGEEEEEESEDEGTKKVKGNSRKAARIGSSILCLISVEVVDSDLAQLSIDKVTEVDKSFLHENGKLDKDPVYNNPIEVDSHSEEPDKEEENGAFDPHFPKDVVNEWPAPKQIYSFHFIRYRFYEDPAIKAKLDQVDKEIRKWNKARFKLTDELKAKRDSSILELAVPHLQKRQRLKLKS
ncbi:proton pump-interactor BIP103 [Gossypium hirsutum]|uniref:Proton pump-interactor BIP103 n=1 Tax=Gossypium hirsutum TaxID=3635 RepID=A0A1U8IEA4_GOSHI|nr:proton pump-interactor BIP103 [Gossypium hirsutum]